MHFGLVGSWIRDLQADVHGICFLARNHCSVDIRFLFVFSPSDNKELTVQSHLCITNPEFFVFHELLTKSHIFWIVAKCETSQFLSSFIKYVGPLFSQNY